MGMRLKMFYLTWLQYFFDNDTDKQIYYYILLQQWKYLLSILVQQLYDTLERKRSVFKYTSSKRSKSKL